MHSYYSQASGAAAAGAGGGGEAGGGGSAALLRNALYGARPAAGAPPHGGTVLYRAFNAAPRDKSILAAAVDDALMSPDTDPVAVASAVDPMLVDGAAGAAAGMLPGGGSLGAEVMADLSRHGSAADGTHRLNMGVVNLAAAADPMTAAAAQPSSKVALYGNYQQAGAGGGDVRDMRRVTAAQLHQLSMVRQMQLRQQAAAQAQAQQQQQAAAAAAAAQQAAAVQRAAAQQQVLAAAAEVAQQVAARHQLRAAAEQRLAAHTAAAAAAAPAAAVPAAAQPALYKRTAAATAAAETANAPTVLYKRPALGAAAAAANAAAVGGYTAPDADPAAVAAPPAGTTALYGAYCADRSAATSAAAVVSKEMLQRLGAAAAAAPTVSARAPQPMSVSSAHQGAESDSHDTGFLDCHEELGDEELLDDEDDADGPKPAFAEHCGSGSASASATLYTASGGSYSGLRRSGSSGGSSAGSITSSGLAAAAAAAAAGAFRCRPRPSGAAAVRPYGLVYCPVVYTDVSSPAALALANEVMSRVGLPGGTRFMPVCTDSMLYYNGVHWGFSAFALALGSSYFQRLVEITPTLRAAVAHAPAFAPYAKFMRDGGRAAAAAAADQQEEYMHKDGLRSILFTCAYLATKVVDRMPHTDMLRRMLSMLYNQPVTREEAHSVELKCLEGLQYRLGPYFITDKLEDEPPCCDVY